MGKTGAYCPFACTFPHLKNNNSPRKSHYLKKLTVNYGLDGTVILFNPIIADNRRLAIFLTHVKSAACAKNKFILDWMELFNQGSIVVFEWKNEQNWPFGFATGNAEELTGYSREEQFKLEGLKKEIQLLG